MAADAAVFLVSADADPPLLGALLQATSATKPDRAGSLASSSMSFGPSFSAQEGQGDLPQCSIWTHLIQTPHFATSRAMRIARISEQERKTTQSGKANAGKWLLEFERQQPLRPDPLTGWNGSGDTGPQVRLFFQTKDAAIAYCKKHDLKHHLVIAPPVRLKLQTYADNFR